MAGIHQFSAAVEALLRKAGQAAYRNARLPPLIRDTSPRKAHYL